MGADPLTLLTLASTAIGTVSQIKQGKVAEARAKEAAAQRDLETQRQLAQLKRESEQRKARNRAIYAQAGGDSQSRSGLALTAENLRRDADNQLAASITGRSQSRAFLLQGQEAKISAYAGAANTAFGGARSLLKGGMSKASGSSKSSGYTPYS